MSKSLPVMMAGWGIRAAVLGPNGAQDVGASGFGRSRGVASGSVSSWPSGSSGRGRRERIVFTMSASSASPVQSPTSSVTSSYALAFMIRDLNSCASSFVISERAPLNWLMQNLVKAQWLSRYLHWEPSRPRTTSLHQGGGLTSRRYDGISVVSKSRRGAGAKHDGLASAAVAIITDDAPKRRHAYDHPLS